jgi:hypothetical protein
MLTHRVYNVNVFTLTLVKAWSGLKPELSNEVVTTCRLVKPVAHLKGCLLVEVKTKVQCPTCTKPT